ncbi:hypothetical protein [Polyangium aurulentum]|uniref:hypothetical protein n=1 Tax=Polyangium aurulentum TaxID=2567896 RepID=UPI0010AE2D7C|nr:hypothetical protein [Polyangium aurulentum]UQA61114.1 hypothetical protein E8A73_011795 [Polyangium aurulentum]
MDPRSVLALAVNELRAGSADAALTRVHELLPSLHDKPDLLAPARAVEAQALAALGRGDEALALLDRGLEEAHNAGLPAHVEGLRGLAEQLRPQIEMARLAAVPVEEIDRMAPNPAARAVLLANKSIAHLALGDLGNAQVLLPLAREAADSSGEPGALVPVLLATAQVFAATDDAPKARRALNEARTVAAEHAPDALPLIDEMQELLEQAAAQG